MLRVISYATDMQSCQCTLRVRCGGSGRDHHTSRHRLVRGAVRASSPRAPSRKCATTGARRTCARRELAATERVNLLRDILNASQKRFLQHSAFELGCGPSESVRKMDRLGCGGRRPRGDGLATKERGPAGVGQSERQAEHRRSQHASRANSRGTLPGPASGEPWELLCLCAGTRRPAVRCGLH